MGLMFAAQGRVIKAKELSPKLKGRTPPTRKEITGFSKGSRRRLLVLFGRMRPRFKGRKTFLTLTFHGMPLATEAKAAFKRFVMRMRRKYEGWSGVWRIDRQPGRGSWHFHLILFNFPFIPQYKLQDIWTECTREDRSIVDVQLIRSMKGVMSYVSNYVAKVSDFSPPTSLDRPPYQHDQAIDLPGRIWGYIEKDALPMDVVEYGVVTDEGLIRSWRRVLRDKSDGKAGEWSAAGFLFMDDALGMLESLMHRGGWYASEWEGLIRDGTVPRSTVSIPSETAFSPDWREIW